MKSIFYRILLYPIALFGMIFLCNINISSNTLENQQLIKSTPFFTKFKVYYSLSFVIIIIGLLEKLNSKKIDNNLLLKVLIFLTSLFFCYQGCKTTQIYTHVSTANIQNIKSPFDDLYL